MKIDTTRFSGFSQLYAQARPRPPAEVCRIVLQYLRRDRSRFTVDLGSGTGLSTGLWQAVSDRLVGIEPTLAMRLEAEKQFPTLEFRDGSSYSTGLSASSVDVVTCSQAFHWMEPLSTLAEVARVLVEGGIFAVYDCHWPVHWDWPAEAAYQTLLREVDRLVAQRPELNQDDVYFAKEEHLANFERSGRFRFCTEVLFQNTEPCTPERFAQIALSQGQVQKLIKAQDPSLEAPLEAFLAVVNQAPARSMRVSYRMVLGVK